MSATLPELLIALTKSDAVDALVPEVLPGVPWAYLDGSRPSDRSSVRAMLVGGHPHDLADFDARTTPQLRFVQAVWTGLDRFPLDRFPAAVSIAGNVGGFAPYVAEHAVALALSAARDLHGAQSAIDAGRLRPAPRQRTLVDATAVILGYGMIGRAIAARLVPFGTRVVGQNRAGTPEAGVAEMFSASRLRDAVRAGSFLFDVRPLTRATVGTIGTVELEAMAPDAVFVNVGRAGTVDEGALYEHLRTHPEFRAAFDVWWEEDRVHGTLTPRYPFSRLPNFYGTPHCADAFAEAGTRAVRMALENLGRYFRDGRPQFVVDRSEYEAPLPPSSSRAERRAPAP